MPARGWIFLGAVLGGLAVILGAFGAHGLAQRLEALGYEGGDVLRRLENYQTAARYQMYHVLAIVAVGMLALQQGSSRWLTAAGYAFLIGILIFSGLLYVLVFAGPEWSPRLGPIVPIGGIFMILGWGLLAIGALRPSGR